MSTERIMAKIEALHTTGVAIDDALASAQRDVATIDGASRACVEFSLDLTKLCDRAQKEVEDPVQLELVMAWLKKAHATIGSRLSALEARKAMTQGRVGAFSDAVRIVSNIKGGEELKIQNIKAAVTGGVVPERKRPAEPAKKKRREEG